MGQRMYPQAQQVLITADGGGSNGRRSRLWKVALRQLSDVTGLEVQHCEIFHRGPVNGTRSNIACFAISPKTGIVVPSCVMRSSSISSPIRQRKPADIEAALDPAPYRTSKKVSITNHQVNLSPAAFHGNDWNYVIKSRDKNQ